MEMFKNVLTLYFPPSTVKTLNVRKATEGILSSTEFQHCFSVTASYSYEI